MGIKVSEYLPLYGLLFNFEYQTGIDGVPISVNDLFEKYPNHELNDTQIRQLFIFDLFSLQTVLKDEGFSKGNVTNYLRDLFDEYRENEGDPTYWIGETLDSVYHNPTNYRADLRTEIESFLVSLWEVYSKLSPPKKPQFLPKEILTLSKCFKNKFGKVEGEKKLNELKNHLFKKSLLSEDLTTWIGIGMNGKTQLASLIKFIGMKYFQTSFSEKQVAFISEMDFSLKMSEGTIKKAKSEFGEVYLTGFL